MTGSHSRLGISDRESRTTGVTRAYDSGQNSTDSGRCREESDNIQALSALLRRFPTLFGRLALALLQLLTALRWPLFTLLRPLSAQLTTLPKPLNIGVRPCSNNVSARECVHLHGPQ